MYQKAIETGEWLKTVYEDEMASVEDVKLRMEEHVTLVFTDKGEGEQEWSFE